MSADSSAHFLNLDIRKKLLSFFANGEADIRLDNETVGQASLLWGPMDFTWECRSSAASRFEPFEVGPHNPWAIGNSYDIQSASGEQLGVIKDHKYAYKLNALTCECEFGELSISKTGGHPVGYWTASRKYSFSGSGFVEFGASLQATYLQEQLSLRYEADFKHRARLHAILVANLLVLTRWIHRQ